ncbi:MAG: cation transporter [Lachnospiraceae bacterium]|nr:cation transporter [Lachnospiraceae bacterium]
MPEIIYKLFCGKTRKPSDNAASAEDRGIWGIVCGISGIILNLLLFGAKLFAGIISASVSIVADAVNNLSDAGSSVVTLLGFKLAGRKADSEHPYGHGRFEYIAALLVSAVIMVMGFELLKESVERIINPSETGLEPAALVILPLSILVKFYMAYYNKHYGKKIDSTALFAVAKDSLCDCLATGAVLIGALLSHYTGLKADGPCGVLVSLFILYSGYSSGKEAIDPLLGTPPEPEFIEHIKDIVINYDERVVGVHDLMIHDYGPGRRIISLHAEVPSDIDMLQAHDVIDNIEKKLSDELGCVATIHMDPVQINDPRVNELKEKVIAIAAEIHPEITVHDFRVVFGDTHTNLVFDMAVPFSCTLDEAQIKEKASKLIRSSLGRRYFAVITIDRG